MSYTCIKPMKVQVGPGKVEQRYPGDAVPEAASWTNPGLWVKRGYIQADDHATAVASGYARDRLIPARPATEEDKARGNNGSLAGGPTKPQKNPDIVVPTMEQAKADGYGELAATAMIAHYQCLADGGTEEAAEAAAAAAAAKYEAAEEAAAKYEAAEEAAAKYEAAEEAAAAIVAAANESANTDPEPDPETAADPDPEPAPANEEASNTLPAEGDSKMELMRMSREQLEKFALGNGVDGADTYPNKSALADAVLAAGSTTQG